MPKLDREVVTSYPKFTISRQEFIDAFGFDPDDAFDVNLLDWGRKGVSFTLNRDRAAKYIKPAPATPETISVITKKRRWWEKDA